MSNLPNETKVALAQLLFWSVVFGIVLCSLMLDTWWQMIGFWWSLYAASWLVKKHTEKEYG